MNHAFSMKLIGRSYDPPIIIKSKDDISTKKERKQEIEKLVNARIEEYIALFSKGGRGKQGLKTGSLGTRKLVIKNLVKWLFENEEYTFDQILVAAEYYIYVESKQSYKYLVNANRFIYNQKGESKLSEIIEESLTEDLQTEIFTAV